MTKYIQETKFRLILLGKKNGLDGEMLENKDRKWDWPLILEDHPCPLKESVIFFLYFYKIHLSTKITMKIEA